MKGLIGHIEIFKKAIERYGVWPTTVWEVDKREAVRLRLVEEIGDLTQNRCNAPGTQLSYSTRHKGDGWVGSIFDPMVCAWILNCFGPTSGVCFDPFAGGGTRAIMAAKKGLEYHGVELRKEEVLAVRQRCLKNEVAEQVRIVRGDARNSLQYMEPASADFIMTCPPYYNLERYGGGENDLSEMATYEDFLRGMEEVIEACSQIIKPGCLAVWVVGLHRDAAGNILAMNHDITRLHKANGFDHREEIVLYGWNNGSLRRVGNFDKGEHRLVRVHEYALVFRRQ